MKVVVFVIGSCDLHFKMVKGGELDWFWDDTVLAFVSCWLK